MAINAFAVPSIGEVVDPYLYQSVCYEELHPLLRVHVELLLPHLQVLHFGPLLAVHGVNVGVDIAKLVLQVADLLEKNCQI